jgi:low temperature requirement protein LtrA
LPTIEPDGEFDVYIHGSDEHLQVVREIHAHHEQKRLELRQKHGSIYEDFENVHTQLNNLSAELQLLTDHGVALDANFSKFGYDAHLRTREPDSSANSISTQDPTGKHDWDAERRRGQALKFWKKPVVRQYFHKGLLWRASDVEEVQSFELFVDLLYVGIIDIIGEHTAEHPDGFGLLKFLITFSIGWKMWADLTLVISWFETDDIFQRLWVMFQLICLFGYTVNIVYAFETTWTHLIAFFMAQRLFTATYYVWIAYMLPMVRPYMIAQTLLVVIPSALWISSIHVDYPNRLGLIWTAICLDLFGALIIVFVFRNIKRYPPKMADKVAKWFEFFPAVNIEHKTERTNAFVTLVFGYSVLALIYQNHAAFGVNAFFGKAVLGLIQAFCFNWLYFEIDASNIHQHAIRRHVSTSMIWISIHLPFIMSYVLASASLSKLVLARDSRDTDIKSLGKHYIERSENHIPDGLRWFYCAGLSIALICMSIISLTHLHKKTDGQRIGKRYRLAVRLGAAVILVFLPLAHGLNSLELVSISTSLVALALMVELYGSTSRHDSFWKDCRVCKYSADCQIKKKDLETAVKTGQKIEITEITKDSKGEKGVYELS